MAVAPNMHRIQGRKEDAEVRMSPRKRTTGENERTVKALTYNNEMRVNINNEKVFENIHS